MKKIIIILIIIFSFNAETFAQCNINILNNPGFETPVQAGIGNNFLGTTFNGWSMTGGNFNVIKTDGSAYSGGPDNAQDGIQYVDIIGAGGTLYQDFTIGAGPVSVGYSGYFSSREQSSYYINWTASIDIIDLATSTVVSTSTTRLFTNADGAIPQQETWYYLFGNVMLPAGNYRYSANFGDYGGFDAARLATNCVLAVSLSSFNGNYDNGLVKLSWKSESESNFSHYEIEKSSDGRNFINIGSVSPSPAHSYTFTDNNSLTSGKNFYRLKIIGMDGKFTYSAIIPISAKINAGLKLSPNPASSNLTVSGLKGNGVIKIYDVSGKMLITKNVQAAQSLSVDISSLSTGLYILKYFGSENSLDNGTFLGSQKFKKQ